MSLSTVPRKVVYDGNGGPFAYVIPFKFFRDEHVKVTLKAPTGEEFEQSLGADYQVSGRGNATGGELRMFENVPTDYKILIFRSVAPYLQNTLFPENGAFPAMSFETALDVIHMALQELADNDAHSFSVSLFETFVNAQNLSLLTVEPGSVLTTDASKNLRWVPINQFMGGGVVDAWRWKAVIGARTEPAESPRNQLVNYGPFRKGDVLIVDGPTDGKVFLRDQSGETLEMPGRTALVCYSNTGGAYWENFMPLAPWKDNRGFPQSEFDNDEFSYYNQPDVPPNPDPIDIVILPGYDSIPDSMA